MAGVLTVHTHARQPWQQALRESGVMALLADFDPRVVGTLPIGVSIEGSDIDILCQAANPDDVGHRLWQAQRGFSQFSMHRWTSGVRPLVASFVVAGWPIEVFASPVPVAHQDGWRHFVVERRLLGIGGEALRERVVMHRRSGLKTEPAFAAALRLGGDPYAGLSALADAPDDALRAIIAAAGFAASHGPDRRP